MRGVGKGEGEEGVVLMGGRGGWRGGMGGVEVLYYRKKLV